MKWPAVLILIALLLAVVLQLIGEFANILKEKIVLNAALVNSCRAAENNSLNIWYMINLEAHVNEDDFIKLFSNAFSKSLDLTVKENTTNKVVFNSKKHRFNDISVEFEFKNTSYKELNDEDLGVTDYHDRQVTLVTVTMKTPYLFRTYWLKLANGVSNGDYSLIDTRKYLIQIIN